MRPESPLSGAQVKAFLFDYFYYFRSFCDRSFQTTKKTHNNKICSEGSVKFLRNAWMYEHVRTIVWRIVRGNEENILCACTWERKKSIPLHICTSKIKYNFLAQKLIDVRRSMITGRVECALIQMKASPQEPLKLF